MLMAFQQQNINSAEIRQEQQCQDDLRKKFLKFDQQQPGNKTTKQRTVGKPVKIEIFKQGETHNANNTAVTEQGQ